MTRISPGLIQRSLKALDRGASHSNVYEMRDLRMELANTVGPDMSIEEQLTVAALDKALAVKGAGDDNLILAGEYMELSGWEYGKKQQQKRRARIQEGYLFS